ncbi:MAG: DsbA family protein [Dehalococcoidia bacterium]
MISQYVESGQVRFVFRHFPFIGEESMWAAEASECAAEQGMFWEYHDQLFAERQGENVGKFAKPNLKTIADKVGLDPERFDPCIDSGRYEASVEAEKEDGKSAGVISTPTVFINGELVKGLQPFEVYKQIIDGYLKGE